MKKQLLVILLIGLAGITNAQNLNYYDGTQGLEGSNLKAVLHSIIDGHTQFQYTTTKNIIRQADEDPNNPDNLILIYTGWSIPKANFAVNLDSLDYWNREHVWAKSHGDFGTDPGPGTDVHALRPVDASVNSARSYKDFDNGGTEYYDNGIPTGCYSDNNSWEPRDEDKGDIARSILYMDVRYEGDNGELDLVAVDQVGTYPNPYHGKLSTLLQWHQQDPPDAREKYRNDVIENWQQNRNPFVDYPEFVDLIWGTASANPISFSNAAMNPTQPEPFDIVNLSVDIQSTSGSISSASLVWGLSWSDLSNTISMTSNGTTWSCDIPGQDAGENIHFRIEASDGTNTYYHTGSYQVSNYPFSGTITPITSVQGTGSASPMIGQTVSIAGIVTAAFGSDFFLQNGEGPRTGMYIYNSGYFPLVGDSVIVTGEVDEYYGKTEVKNISDYYYISSNNPMPEPLILSTGEVSHEDYESVLVKVVNAECVRDTLYGMWFVDDGSGEAIIHNSAIYTHPYAFGQFYDIMGIMNYDFDQFKIELRGPDDVEAGTDNFAPYLINVTPVNNTILYLVFNEQLDYTGVDDVNNYSITNGVNVIGAMLHSIDHTKVILTVANLNGGSYTLTVNNLMDLSGNAIDSETFNFDYLSLPELSSNILSIFPNPTQSQINVVIPESFESGTLEIFSLDGKEVYSSIPPIGGSSIEIDLTGMAKGVYIIEYKTNNMVARNKVIFE